MIFSFFYFQSDTYELVSYSDNFKDYLSEIGVPSFVQNLIMGTSETLEIEILEDGCRSKMESGKINPIIRGVCFTPNLKTRPKVW